MTDLQSFLLHNYRPIMGSAELATWIEASFIVIDKNDLPPIDTASDPGWIVSGGSVALPVTEPEQLRTEANEKIALALYLEANQPLDREQVDKIWGVLDEVMQRHVEMGEAEALYRMGVRVQ